MNIIIVITAARWSQSHHEGLWVSGCSEPEGDLRCKVNINTRTFVWASYVSEFFLLNFIKQQKNMKSANKYKTAPSILDLPAISDIPDISDIPKGFCTKCIQNRMHPALVTFLGTSSTSKIAFNKLVGVPSWSNKSDKGDISRRYLFNLVLSQTSFCQTSCDLLISQTSPAAQTLSCKPISSTYISLILIYVSLTYRHNIYQLNIRQLDISARTQIS